MAGPFVLTKKKEENYMIVGTLFKTNNKNRVMIPGYIIRILQVSKDEMKEIGPVYTKLHMVKVACIIIV